MNDAGQDVAMKEAAVSRHHPNMPSATGPVVVATTELARLIETADMLNSRLTELDSGLLRVLERLCPHSIPDSPLNEGVSAANPPGELNQLRHVLDSISEHISSMETHGAVLADQV